MGRGACTAFLFASPRSSLASTTWFTPLAAKVAHSAMTRRCTTQKYFLK
jgi:hypothetical protein